MLDSESQKKVVSHFYDKTDYQKISINKLLSFSGILEIIRRIRNVVNHYEPIFPFLASEMKQHKNIRIDGKYYKSKIKSEPFDSLV